MERQALGSLCAIDTNELLRLQQLFSCHHDGGLMMPEAFWRVAALGAPLLALRAPRLPSRADSVVSNDGQRSVAVELRDGSALHSQMFAVFDQLRLGALTCFEFVLAVCVMAGRATFLPHATFMFDVCDANHDQCVDADEVARIVDSIQPHAPAFVSENVAMSADNDSNQPVLVGANDAGELQYRCAAPLQSLRRTLLDPAAVQTALLEGLRVHGDADALTRDAFIARLEGSADLEPDNSDDDSNCRNVQDVERARQLMRAPFALNLIDLMRFDEE
jgi:hypothetical protein